MRKDAVRSSLLALALAVLLLLSALPHVVASGLTEYKLGEATFNVPSDWKVTERRKNRAFTFESANGKMTFWAEWWLQDEPILGYPDIVSHKTVTVDGRKATYVHTRTNGLNSLAAVFDQPRADGRKFLMHLESGSEKYTNLAAAFDSLLSRTTFANGDASRQKAEPQVATSSDKTGVLEPAPQPEVSVGSEAIVEPSADAAGDVAGSTLGDCDFGQSEWAQKARNVLKRHSGSRFLWAGVCRDGSQLIVGGDFPFDPNGAAGDFFSPLYFDLLEAADDQSFILAVPKDRVMIKVTATSDSKVSIEFSEFPETFRPEGGLDVTPDNATEPESDTFGDARTDAPATPAEADLIRTAGMDDPALWLLPTESQKFVLFDGNEDTSRWTHYASSKGGFDLLARFEDGGFTVEVPA